MNNQLKNIGNYWSDRSMEFSKYMLEHSDEELDKDYYRLIREVVGVRKIRAIDIGCGPGIAAMMLAEMGNDIYAVDWSEGMIEQVTKNSKDRGLDIHISRMDAQNLEFEDGFFDLVVSSRLVWNLPDPIRAYSEWMRVLKPSGSMVIYDGNYFLEKKDKELPAEEEDDQPQMYQGADFRVIRNIAKDLPLSKEIRPAWDVGLLTSIGVKDIHILIENYGRHDAEEMSIPSTFVLVVKKEDQKGDSNE